MNAATDPNAEAADPAASTPPGAIPASVALWSALVAAHAALDRTVERDPGRCAVIGPDVLGVLLPLATSPNGRLRLGDLAERAGLTPSGLTRRIEALVADGLIVRAHCDSDRRGIWAAITPKALAALPGALEHHAEVLERSIRRSLASEDVARLTELLEALARP
jgi:MarR family 2-MHQ and catechol resistance regulon transcriptional repressor